MEGRRLTPRQQHSDLQYCSKQTFNNDFLFTHHIFLNNIIELGFRIIGELPNNSTVVSYIAEKFIWWRLILEKSYYAWFGFELVNILMDLQSIFDQKSLAQSLTILFYFVFKLHTIMKQNVSFFAILFPIAIGIFFPAFSFSQDNLMSHQIGAVKTFQKTDHGVKIMTVDNA